MFRDILPRSSRASVMEYNTRSFMVDTSLRGQVDLWRLWLGGRCKFQLICEPSVFSRNENGSLYWYRIYPNTSPSGCHLMRSDAVRCQVKTLTDSVGHSW